LAGVLAPIVEILALSMLHRRHHLAVCDPIESELVRDQHPRRVTLVFEKCAEEPGRRPAVPFPLDENVEHVAVLIDRPPQILLNAIDLDEHLVEVPLIARSGCPTPQLAGALGTEPRTPGTDRLVRHLDPTLGHQ
jgi:hypothetical protein